MKSTNSSIAGFAAAAAMLIASSAAQAAETIDTVVARSVFVAPEFAYSDRSQAVGFLLGGRMSEDVTVNERTAPFVKSLRLKALAVFASSRLEGGVVTGNMSWGANPCVPLSFEAGMGSAFGNGRSIGVLETGLFFGTADSFQLGVNVYTPLSTSDKPTWFQDWSVSARFPFSLGQPKKLKARTTIEEG